MQPGMSISYVARRHGLSPSLVFRWRRLMSEGGNGVRWFRTFAMNVSQIYDGDGDRSK
jgi:hypothetical protein